MDPVSSASIAPAPVQTVTSRSAQVTEVGAPPSVAIAGPDLAPSSNQQRAEVARVKLTFDPKDIDAFGAAPPERVLKPFGVPMLPFREIDAVMR